MPTKPSQDKLHAMRHSLAHIMAAAIQELYPEAKFGVGPVVENGFYYDVELPATLSADDLSRIEDKMAKIVKADHKFEHSTMSLEKALEYFEHKKQSYKVELLKDLHQYGTTVAKEIDSEALGVEADKPEVVEVSIYTSGDFTDLCRGPHVESTGEVGAFKLTKVAGAYWRGNEKNPQLQRVYGVGFVSEAELEKYLHNLEEAERRDHRKLGQELDLFLFSDLVGQGLPLWTPRGTVLRQELDRFVQELRAERGYQAVTIPHLTKPELYEKSGHWSKFSNELFKIKTREGHELAIKPMNCPHHTQIYAARPRSYRELPVRYHETTMVYRDEQSGELGGLSRVRAITQDDAHVFCRISQIESEITQIIEIVQEFYGRFRMPLSVRFSTHNPDRLGEYLGTAETWQQSEQQLQKVLERVLGKDYEYGAGDAAFYGPKIDFLAEDALGRQHQVATIQLDFGQPEGFDLACINEGGERERIVMVHAAIMGSIERFLAVLIEHYGGAFPVWLAPEQIRVATVNDSAELTDFAHKVVSEAGKAGLRAELDADNESVGKKIRAAELVKVPYTLVVGEKELTSGEVIPRVRQDLAVHSDGQAMKLELFIKSVANEAKSRAGRASL